MASSGVFGLGDAARLQMASHLVGVRDIHLAPVGAHVILHKPKHYTCRMHEVPIEDSIDLHTFQPREIAIVVEEYLYQAVAKGFREVRIIHGRGIGVQREIVRSILTRASQRAVVPGRPRPGIDDGGFGGVERRLPGRSGHRPSWPGGVAAPIRRKCEASEAAQTGWWFRSKSSFDLTTTPSARSKEASRDFS